MHHTRYFCDGRRRAGADGKNTTERDMGASRCTDGHWPPKHGKPEGRETVRRLLRLAAEAVAEAVAEAAAVAAVQIAAAAAAEGRS